MNDEIAFANFIKEQIIDINLDPCSKGILDKLKNLKTNDIAKVLDRFGSPKSKYFWEIKSGTPRESSNVFETNWNLDSSGEPISYNYVTTVKTSYVNKSTDLSIARVILNEAIHAYMLSYIDDVITNNTNTVIVSNFQDNFSEVWNYYVAKQNGVTVGNLEDAHHNQMASTFIETIGEALAEFDNNQQQTKYYYYLAWGALFETDAWARLELQIFTTMRKILLV